MSWKARAKLSVAARAKQYRAGIPQKGQTVKYLIIDTETSGIFDFRQDADAPGQPRMCDLAMIFADENLFIERFVNQLIKPDGWKLDPASDAVRVHGLTQEMLEKDGVNPRDALRQYGDAIDDRRIVVAFNVSYDLKMMRAEMRRVGYPDRYMQTRYLCIMQGCRSIVDARTERGAKKAPTMEEACKFFGLTPEPKPHRAIHGASSALAILRQLRDRGMMPAYKDPYEEKAKKALEPRKAKRPRPRLAN